MVFNKKQYLILFSLYVHDLLIKIENIYGFADDIVIYHSSNRIDEINKKLQDSYNLVEKYASDWYMRINVDKCESILLRFYLFKNVYYMSSKIANQSKNQICVFVLIKYSLLFTLLMYH